MMVLGGIGVIGKGVPELGGGVLHAALLGVVVLLVVLVATLCSLLSSCSLMLELIMEVRLVCTSCKSDVVHLLICC